MSRFPSLWLLLPPKMLLATPSITNCVLQAANDEAYLSSVLARESLRAPANAEPSYGRRPKRRKSQGMTQVFVGAEGQSGVSLSFSAQPGLPPNPAVCPCGRLLVPRRKGCIRKKKPLPVPGAVLLFACLYFHLLPSCKGRSRIKAAQSGRSRGKSGKEWQRLKEHIAERLACSAL